MAPPTVEALPRLGDRLMVLRWARSLEGQSPDPRVRASNDAVESCLAGITTRRALRKVAYLSNDLPCETGPQAMAWFAAEAALERRISDGFMNEAEAKAEEMGAQMETGIEPGVDAFRWIPDEADAELEAWGNLLAAPKRHRQYLR